MTGTPFSLTKGQKLTLVVVPQDASGNVAALVSKPVWTVSDPSVFSLAPSADGLSCVAQSLKVGNAIILSDAVGATPLEAEADATVTLPLATRLVLSGQVG